VTLEMAAPSVKAGLAAAGVRKETRSLWSGCCPFSLAEPAAAFDVAALACGGELGAGWLLKKGRKVPTKKRRFFVLRVGALAYYEDESRATLKGTVPLWPRTVVSFDARGPGAERGKMRVRHPELAEERDLYAATRAECAAWVAAIEGAQRTGREGGSREGRLHKRGGWTRHDWQPRWCVFDGAALFASYRAASDDRPTVSLDLGAAARGAVRPLAKLPAGAPPARKPNARRTRPGGP